MSDENPYQPPTHVETSAEQIALWTRVSSRWTIVFALNLPLPIFFALGLITGHALFGVLAVVACFWCIGVVLAQHNPTFMQLLSTGGTVIALSQFFPIVHIIAGSIALGILEKITGKEHDPDFEMPDVSTVFDGACATFATAGILLCAALLFGLLLKLVSRTRT